MDLFCQDKRCLCHSLCTSGHFIKKRDINTSLGCTYFPYINRHIKPEVSKVLSICSCSGGCSGSRSAGQVNISYDEKAGKWVRV